ncbi:hypothetical protein C8J57DRAFT_1522219 [Mycena rebaudengoi]|nr:hypothetical protein C8J57DRAFT_1522219 [Mycena rebaudengoi]
MPATLSQSFSSSASRQLPPVASSTFNLRQAVDEEPRGVQETSAKCLLFLQLLLSSALRGTTLRAERAATMEENENGGISTRRSVSVRRAHNLPYQLKTRRIFQHTAKAAKLYHYLFASGAPSPPHNYFGIFTVKAVGLLNLSPRSSRIGEAMLTPDPHYEGARLVTLLPRQPRPDGFTERLHVHPNRPAAPIPLSYSHSMRRPINPCRVTIYDSHAATYDPRLAAHHPYSLFPQFFSLPRAFYTAQAPAAVITVLPRSTPPLLSLPSIPPLFLPSPTHTCAVFLIQTPHHPFYTSRVRFLSTPHPTSAACLSSRPLATTPVLTLRVHPPLSDPTRLPPWAPIGKYHPRSGFKSISRSPPPSTTYVYKKRSD